jgi:hypothetical protein
MYNSVQLYVFTEVPIMIKTIIFLCVILVFVASLATAENSYLTAMKARYNIDNGSKLNSCTTCHSGQWARNDYGQDLEAAGIKTSTTAAFAATDTVDSDNDGPDNEEELRAGTWPADPGDIAPVQESTWGRIKALYN